jgi:very-short-patch-repair endonuclease
MSRKKTLEEYVKDFNLVHDSYYEYPKNQVINGNRSKIKIICPIHGEFVQQISAHKSGQKCPHCAKNKISQAKKLNIENFVKDAISVHGNKYDYTNSVYVDNKTKVGIVCPEHGVFYQTRNNHIIQKQGCPQCGLKNRKNSKTLTTEQFIEKSKNIHNNLYDYTNVEYINSKTPVKLICKHHGEFDIIPYNHLKGAGCKKCKIEQQRFKLSRKSEYIDRVNLIHREKYSYPSFDNDYNNVSSKITIMCPKHGEFTQIAKDHLRGCGCPKCSNQVSKYEEFIKRYLEKNNIKYKERVRDLIKPYEIDILLPEHKLAIEINGVYWHGEQSGKDKHYHKNKTNMCESVGYKLIHFFEDELQKEKIILSKLKTLLKINKKPIYARKCKVKEIGTKTKVKFLNKYHLQGNCKSSKSIGLYYKNRLVSVMTFGKNRSGETELNRFCSVFNFYIIGGASKLFKYYIKHHGEDYVVSYADLTLSGGDMYHKLGFFLDNSKRSSEPDYKYYNRAKSSYIRHHKSKFSKSRLENEIDEYDPDKTEWENMKYNGWDRIWDCGKLRFVYNILDK